MNDPLDIRYLAGFIDGEGCFSIATGTTTRGTYYKGVLNVSNSNIEILQRVRETIGAGNVNVLDTQRVSPSRRWRTTALVCRNEREAVDELDRLRSAAMAVSVALDEIGVHAPNDRPWSQVRGSDWLEGRVRELRALVPDEFADAWIDRYCSGDPADNSS